MPSDHFKTSPKWLSYLLLELQGHMCYPGAKMSPPDEGIFWYVVYWAVAREPFDLDKKSWYQNVPQIIYNKIRLKDIGSLLHFEC